MRHALFVRGRTQIGAFAHVRHLHAGTGHNVQKGELTPTSPSDPLPCLGESKRGGKPLLRVNSMFVPQQGPMFTPHHLCSHLRLLLRLGGRGGSGGLLSLLVALVG